MGTQGVIPAALGQSVDAITQRNGSALILWRWSPRSWRPPSRCGRHAPSARVSNFLEACVRVQQLVIRAAIRLGAGLPRQSAP